MITIPVYELLLLPEVTFFFKKDMFPEGRIKEQNIGEEILFVLQKKEIAPEEISMENIFPVGVMGIIENIDEEGSVKITTRKRVQVTHVEYTDGMVQAEAVDLPDIQDISPEEEKEKFDKIKAALNEIGIGGMTVTKVSGCGVQKGQTSYYRGAKVNMELLPKLKVEVVVSEVPVADVVMAAKKALYTGNIGDGKIFVYDVADVVRISTGARGKDALKYEE